MKISEIIIKLRTDLNGTVFESGGVTRIGGAADFQDVLRGSKVPVPAIFCMLGDTVVEQSSSTGVSLGIIKQQENLVLMVMLDGKADTPAQEGERGLDPVSKMHDIKIQINDSLNGFNPSIADAQAGQSYGYCSKEFRYSHDGTFDFTRAWYIHEIRYELESSIDTTFNGIGPSQPQGTDDLENISTDIEPVEVSITEQPAIQSVIDFT